MRCTEQEAQANLLAVLHLCGAGKLRCSQKTHRPGASTVAAVGAVRRGPRRKTVGQVLAACAPGQWTQVDDLLAAMRKSGLDFTIARSGRAPWKLYLRDPQYSSLGYDGFHDWPLLQGRYTLAVLFEYAATLGLIDIEYVPPVGARDI